MDALTASTFSGVVAVQVRPDSFLFSADLLVRNFLIDNKIVSREKRHLDQVSALK